MSSVDQTFQDAISALNGQKLGEAERLFKSVLAMQPDHVGALNLLTIVLMSLEQFSQAEETITRALQIDQSSDVSFYNCGLILKKNGKPRQALQQFDRALQLNPNVSETWNNRGTVFNELEDYPRAVADFDRAISLNGSYSEAFCNKGKSLSKLDRHDEALAAYGEALAINPGLAEAWLGRGTVFAALNRFDDALSAYDKALEFKSDLAGAWLARSNALSVLGRFDEARSAHRRALAIRPDLIAAVSALTTQLLAEGDVAEAFQLARRALAANDTPEAKALVVLCLSSPQLDERLADVRGLLLRALSEPWVRPSDLAGTTIRVLALNPAIRDGVERVLEGWPKQGPMDELVRPSSVAAIARDELLRTLLEVTPVCDAGLERFATALRSVLLATARSADSAVPESVLDLYGALARQCFINSYVFDHSDAEIEQARALRETLLAALVSGTSVPALLPVAVAAYFPLYTVPGAERLLDRTWAQPVNAVLIQQIREPIEERRLRASMPVLTTIDDAVSVLVRDQYEQYPYPRWVKTVFAGEPRFVGEYIRRTFPHSPLVEPGPTGAVDLLVAGCGTGQHSIETALQFKDAQVLAVDLSLASLSYAQRQTSALGLSMIRYAQADLMKLPSLGRTFDVIESIGVLHHLADPWAGWRALISILRPGGLMRLGFYSDIARAMFSAARELIARQGQGRTDDDIRRFRQQVFDCADGAPLKNVLFSRDFFSLSECRDLLFHAQEHRLTLPEIAAFMGENGLRFIGFELDLQIKRNYARQFPDDVAMTDLMQWHRYEIDNPRTFLGMYQFWVQKV